MPGDDVVVDADLERLTTAVPLMGLLVDWCSGLCTGGLVDNAMKNFLSIFITWTYLSVPTEKMANTVSVVIGWPEPRLRSPVAA